MNTIFKIFTLIIFISRAFGQESNNLYTIRKGNQWGYIDKTGKTIIKPKFFNAEQFSEGLAPVRLNGTYGYINQSGDFIISPKYDFALPFINGQAKVFINGKPFFIDKKGNITFQHNFKNISSFGNKTYAIAVTQTEKYCLINKTGGFITDTIFKEITPFVDGISVIRGLNHLPYTRDTSKETRFEVGVIDTTGKWIVTYGQYKDIGNFENGFALVVRFNKTEKEEGWSRADGIIDKKGNLKFKIPAGKYYFDFNNRGFHNGLAVVQIYAENNDYKGVINTNGEIVFSDTNWEEITPFTFNRAFVQDKKEKWKLIDRTGKQVCDSTFDKIMYRTYRGKLDELFIDGIAYVKISSGWVAIDTTGAFVSQPRTFSEIDYNNLEKIGDIIFFEENIKSRRYSFRYGFWNPKNNAMIKPTYHDIDRDGFNNDLIYAMKDGRIYYINNKGEVIWKEGKSRIRKTTLNIDFMNRGYYYASSKYKKELAGLGGWGGSKNEAKSIKLKTNHLKNQLEVFVNPTKKTKWEGYKAIKLFVSNNSNDTLYFNAQDSRIYLKIQAKDGNGDWKDIEYLPSSWCGNSYHTLFLAPNEQWEFKTPVYHGEIKTTFRAQLLYKKTNKQKTDDIIYSNQFDGYINPAQFWKKRDYYPTGLMDPYND